MSLPIPLGATPALGLDKLGGQDSGLFFEFPGEVRVLPEAKRDGKRFDFFGSTEHVAGFHDAHPLEPLFWGEARGFIHHSRERPFAEAELVCQGSDLPIAFSKQGIQTDGSSSGRVVEPPEPVPHHDSASFFPGGMDHGEIDGPRGSWMAGFCRSGG